MKVAIPISDLISALYAVQGILYALFQRVTTGRGQYVDIAMLHAMVSLMVGREVRSLYPRSSRAPGEVVLQVTGLRGMAKPLDASLDVRRGEVLGLRWADLNLDKARLAIRHTIICIAYQVVESVQQFLDGKAAHFLQMPRYYTVGVNAAVARSLGLQLPSGSDLQEQLRSLDQ